MVVLPENLRGTCNVVSAAIPGGNGPVVALEQLTLDLAGWISTLAPGLETTGAPGGLIEGDCRLETFQSWTVKRDGRALPGPRRGGVFDGWWSAEERGFYEGLGKIGMKGCRRPERGEEEGCRLVARDRNTDLACGYPVPGLKFISIALPAEILLKEISDVKINITRFCGVVVGEGLQRAPDSECWRAGEKNRRSYSPQYITGLRFDIGW